MWIRRTAIVSAVLVLAGITTMIIVSLAPEYLPRNEINDNLDRHERNAPASGPSIYSATFNVKYQNMAPDGVQRTVITINDKFPGPTIIVKRNTTINIKICNQLGESASVHWHGMLQHQTVEMDGVPGITQCPILAGQCYQYTFLADQSPGTYWFHSHSAVQLGDGLQGALVINDPNDPWAQSCNSEDTFLLTEWNHTPFKDLLVGFLSAPVLEPVPNNTLINGIGQWNCSYTTTCKYYRTFIKQGTTKRIRLINSSLYSKITVTIDQHVLRVVEADGIPLKGDKYVRTIRLNPGQRYSCLITAKSYAAKSYWIRSTVHPYSQGVGIYANATRPTVLAILQYTNDGNENVPVVVPSVNTINNDDPLIDQSFMEGEIFADEKGLVTMQSFDNHVFPGPATKQLIFTLGVAPPNPQVTFTFNGFEFTHPTNQTVLSSVITNNVQALNEPLILKIEKGDVIDLIINNNIFLPHPMHLHGHDIWIVGLGTTDEGFYNGTVPKDSVYTDKNPVLRDTASVNPFTFLIMRFVANNPGVWIMHCHNDWHLNLGMAMVFVERQAEVRNYYLQHKPPINIPTSCQSMGAEHGR